MKKEAKTFGFFGVARTMSRYLAVLAGWLFATASYAQSPRIIGTLTPFYRATQLQGHLFGMGLMRLPDYLEGSDLAFPYRKKPGMDREIPFVDSFVINRVMGGYPEAWLEKFKLLRGNLGRRSLDYMIRLPDGSLQFRPDLIVARLKPYLDAGYKPGDITLALDDVPWDLATPDGAAPGSGAYGRNSPPGNLEEWSTVVRHFASDLRAYLGAAAIDVGFETGVEFDTRSSFNGTAEQFFAYYRATEQALHAVLPGARFNPGEFTGLGICSASDRNCVYDTNDLLAFTARERIPPNYIPRSLHALADRGDPGPAATVERMQRSYARLPPVVEEIHQFGLLFEPFGESLQGDPGPMQANWEFQTLMRLMAADHAPRRVFHWGGFASAFGVDLLNGSGFLRLVLDHYIGRSVTTLATHDEGSVLHAEVYGVALTMGRDTAVILSSFSVHPVPGTRQVGVQLPAGMLKGARRFRAVRYGATDNVFAMIRGDLQRSGNLRPEFAADSLLLGNPAMMAVDAGKARTLVQQSASRYIAKLQSGLRWQQGASGVIETESGLSAMMQANELLVLEPE